ncbi:MAG TPA: hypothetical protein DEA22_13775 [Blastocatellia bacterium]|nr:hypothetical protein [Blastocatellia bacterium]
MKSFLRFTFLFAFVVIVMWPGNAMGQPPKPVLVVLNKSDNNLAIVDPVGMKVIAKVPTGEGPHEVVLSDDGRIAYAANYGGQTPGTTLSVIDVANAKEIRRVDLSPLIRPHGLHLIGTKLYFTAETSRAVARYDTAANKVDWIMGTGQNGSHMITGTGDEKRFYAANIGSDSVTAFEFQNPPPAGSRVMHIAVGKQPEAIMISPDGREGWVGLNTDRGIDIIDTATGKAAARIDLGGRPYRVKFTPDGKRAVIPIWPSNELVIVDAVTRKEIKRIKLDSTPFGIVLTADGRTAFVSALQPDSVLKIDLQTGEIIGRIETGKTPDGIALFGM